MNNIYNDTFSFAKEKVECNSLNADLNAEFPVKSFEALKENGYMGLLVPVEYGGKGLTILEHTQTILALAQSCATTALCYMMHNVATMCIVSHGSKELKERLLPKIAKAEITLALAYSETGTGTHFYQPEIKCEEKDNSLVLNGRKSFVTSAGYADYFLVLSQTLNKEALNNWIISKDSKGLEFHKESWDGLGMRGNASMPISFKDVVVDDSMKIGPEGSGAEQVFAVVAPFFIIGLSAVYTGVALNASEQIKNHAMQRTYSNNESLSLIPTIQNDLATVYIKAQSAKHFTIAAAKAGLNMQEDALTQIIAARINGSSTAIEVCSLSMKIGGGTAYAKRLPIERLLRDSFASQVMAPSTDVLSIWLGKALTGQQIP